VCHTLVHNASFKLGKEALPQMIVERVKELPIEQARIAIPMALYLAWVIRKSTAYTKDEPNKKVKFMAEIHKQTSQRLRALTDHWGLKSKTEALEYLVNKTYADLFLPTGEQISGYQITGTSSERQLPKA
jgi:hypothetical protein